MSNAKISERAKRMFSNTKVSRIIINAIVKNTDQLDSIEGIKVQIDTEIISIKGAGINLENKSSINNDNN